MQLQLESGATYWVGCFSILKLIADARPLTAHFEVSSQFGRVGNDFFLNRDDERVLASNPLRIAQPDILLPHVSRKQRFIPVERHD
jgi:hypothetical protein